MNSEILNTIGLGGIDPAIYLIVLLALVLILFIIVLVQGKKNRDIQKRITHFMKGKEAASLEDEIVTLFEDVERIRGAQSKNNEDIENLYKKMKGCYQKIGLVKYDAFAQMGGQMSYALCMLDDKDNGFLLNSVHSLEGSYSYMKEIHHGESKLELGSEEQQALKDAVGLGL